MRLSPRLPLVVLAATFFPRLAPAAPNPVAATLHVDTAAPGPALDPHLYGIFFEDINYGADGGLYAELVQNRSFEYYPVRDWATRPATNDFTPLTAWSAVERDGRHARLSVDIREPLDPHNPNYLVLRLTGTGGTAGVANSGYDGIPVTTGALYDFSLYARQLDGAAAPLHIALEAPDGSEIASADLPAPGADWAKQTTTLTAARAEPAARLVVTTAAHGRLALDMVSLFPRDTFKARPNGLRRDLAEAIAALHPKFMRFPGGCIVHGTGLANAYRWKDTVGDVATRRPNWNRWGYHQSCGLGYFEYFQFCEDIGAAPLPILPAGVSCGFEKPFQACTPAELGTWIQDAIDLVEFANGPADSRWGSVRAAMGHPASFGLTMLGIGNEEHDTAELRALYPKFIDAFRAACPGIRIVGTSGLSPEIPLHDLMTATGVDISDEHYYRLPEWFLQNQHRFDAFARRAPRVYVGEYASKGNTLYNAVAEAVYLTGIERNADQVVMTSYAPLLARYGHTQWTQANLIWFDATRVVHTPNYYVQQLFSTSAGGRYVPSRLSSASDIPVSDVGISVTHREEDDTWFIKIANPCPQAFTLRIALDGLPPQTHLTGRRTVLAGDRDAANDLDHPDRIAPVVSAFAAGPVFDCPTPPMSVQVLRLAPR